MLELTTLLQQSIRLDRRYYGPSTDSLAATRTVAKCDGPHWTSNWQKWLIRRNGSKFGRFIVAKRILIRHTAQRC